MNSAMQRNLFIFFLGILVLLPTLRTKAQETGDYPVSIDQLDDRLVVHIGDGEAKELFTEYRFAGFAKPVLYPVFGAPGVAMTRHYPIDKGHANEQKDHPHHKSIWFAHGDVNGADFWAEKSEIRHQQIERVDSDGFVVASDWMHEGEVLCKDLTAMRFSAGGNWRAIDYSITISATEGPVTFGDTKEGTFAIRTHPGLRLVTADKQPNGSAFNSQGVRGKSIWGKRAKWVHYQGQVDEQTWGVTVMDHPSSLRHPTTWHAREYGLIAANPFGLSYFQKKEKGAGDYTLEEGQSVTLRFKVWFHRGELTTEEIEKRFLEFADN